ncbi:transcriptional repressor CTCFL-like [Bombus pascuorum]|uniref:transcriptional repressor CTCFL-like n=1 Tax=Bombus pascuorum TaxID=65598 RepID=UPI00212EFAE5|nr:transcriptional repressor CTCFL-like [Bombus pascuorum]XP_060811113.1 transcriptional repressor CTCFL-like [Bombus pascuorum]XP_060811114.1 transcriptional repressor CTCFL-like [Bombus pascuorum]XP_060811115.1 transcriptional repressor CTCFL-like [Bombus pascuorum]XP_060811116.1 transcriptional repressor CTCFL-like [Bombus pascuorum]XP_060811117.1 transcriptional repressor CTCFL-like [Bombus pascuorum]
MTSNITTIKLEEEQESVTEIQTYLETFNREIEGGQGEQLHHVQLQQVEGLSGGEEGGTYFVDQSGQYYYQANNDETPVMTQVQIQEVEETDVQNEDETLEEEEFHEIGELENVDGDEDGQIASNENNEVVINSGDPYQTVTIVPSATNSDEVSYVLIVEQPNEEDKESRLVEQEGTEGEEGKGEQDLTVYDFEDNEDNEVPVESEVEDDKTKIVKILPKKSQTVTQAHMCNYCNYTSPKRYLLSRHMKSHSEERPHKCSVCERGFKTLASLQNHVNTHTGTKPHRCKFCESAFTTSGELVRHVRYRHTHEKPHKCPECDYASVELSKLHRHIRCHTGERPYQCPHCTYASPDTFKLKRHLRIHTGEKPYECDFCQARFTQSNSLKAHKLIHNVGSKPVFQCELCPVTCRRKTDLRIHVQKLHTSDKPLKCKRCGKSFPDRYSYKLHSKTHEGEKCYKCDLCPYASISERHLESHMLIHTDQKPYQCDHCFQSFRQKQLLKRHCNLYHNPSYVPPAPQEKSHQCPECERSFRHKGNLIRHMAVHDPESSIQEKQQALKMGRQKKIQIIDGQRVEVMTGDLATKLKDYEEEDEDDVMAVEGNDGQQYVVLEVIQLADNQGTDQQMAVVANEDGDLLMQDSLSQESGIVTGKIEEGDEVKEEDMEIDELKMEPETCTKSLSRNMQSDPKLQKEMETCFGFDEEEEEEEEANDNINILHTIS